MSGVPITIETRVVLPMSPWASMVTLPVVASSGVAAVLSAVAPPVVIESPSTELYSVP